MSSSEDNPRDRILAAAGRLFDTHGYPNTGINLIVKEARAARASLYDYFPSKEDLGREYLRTHGERQLAGLYVLMKRFPEPDAFVTAWVHLLKRQARQHFSGCPMANLSAQIGDTSSTLSDDVKLLAVKTISALSQYLQSAGIDSPALIARRLFACYEGVLQVWRLTGQKAAFDDLGLLARSLFS